MLPQGAVGPSGAERGQGLPGLISNGSAVPLYIPDSPVYAFGTDDLGFTLRITLASYTPSSNTVLLDKVSSNLGVRITLLTTGVLRVQFGNGTNLTTYQYDSSAGLGTVATGGQPVWLDFNFARSGNMTVTVNGTQLGTTVSISGSSAQTLTSTAPLRLFSDGTNHFAGVLHAFYPRNVSLTSAERTVLYLGGPGALPNYRQGACQAIRNLARNSTFTASATDWTVASLDTVNQELDTTSQFQLNLSFTALGNLDVGQRFRLSGTIRNFTGFSSANVLVYGANENFGAIAGNGAFSVTATVAAAPNETPRRIGIFCNGSGSASLTNVTLTAFGFLGIYEIGEGSQERGLVLLDRTAARCDAIRTSAESTFYSHNGRRAIVRATVAHGAGTTDVQLLGQAAIDVSRRWRIDSVQVVSDASVNVSLGLNSGGTTYVNAQAASAATTDITIASRMINSAAPNLWSRSTGTANLTWIINLVAAD